MFLTSTLKYLKTSLNSSPKTFKIWTIYSNVHSRNCLKRANPSLSVENVGDIWNWLKRDHLVSIVQLVMRHIQYHRTEWSSCIRYVCKCFIAIFFLFAVFSSLRFFPLCSFFLFAVLYLLFFSSVHNMPPPTFLILLILVSTPSSIPTIATPIFKIWLLSKLLVDFYIYWITKTLNYNLSRFQFIQFSHLTELFYFRFSGAEVSIRWFWAVAMESPWSFKGI